MRRAIVTTTSDGGPYLLGIDYGTESCRVAIFTGSSQLRVAG